MMTWALALSLLTAHSAIAPIRPQVLSAAETDSIAKAFAAARAEADSELRDGPTSYLAAIQRVDFGAATRLVIGRDADCGVRVDDPEMPAHALAVTVEGDSFHVAAIDPSTAFRWKHLAYVAATVGPSAIELGRWTLRLSHQRFPAIIVFDPRTPGRAAYKGLAYYPVDLHYRFLARLMPAPHPDTVIIQSTRGNRRRALRVGWFDLEIDGHPCRLEAHRLLEPGVDESSVNVFFRDATTGHTTYPVGRYVDPEPQADGRWIVDFNAAYNPACAFSPHYNCPIPTRANTLPVAIRAGEKDAHYPH
jgi:uncharacterized protein (DUF1684 family)